MASNVEFYDSSMKAKSIERDFSNIVETPVPKDGKTLDAMYRFHKRYGIAPRIGQEWRDEHGRDLFGAVLPFRLLPLFLRTNLVSAKTYEARGARDLGGRVRTRPLKFYSATSARQTSQATTIIDGMSAESTPSKKFKFCILAD